MAFHSAVGYFGDGQRLQLDSTLLSIKYLHNNTTSTSFVVSELKPFTRISSDALSRLVWSAAHRQMEQNSTLLALKRWLKKTNITVKFIDCQDNVWLFRSTSDELHLVFVSSLHKKGFISSSFKQAGLSVAILGRNCDSILLYTGYLDGRVQLASVGLSHDQPPCLKNLQSISLGSKISCLMQCSQLIYIGTVAGTVIEARLDLQKTNEITIPYAPSCFLKHLDRLWVGTTKGLYLWNILSNTASKNGQIGDVEIHNLFIGATKSKTDDGEKKTMFYICVDHHEGFSKIVDIPVNKIRQFAMGGLSAVFHCIDEHNHQLVRKRMNTSGNLYFTQEAGWHRMLNHQNIPELLGIDLDRKALYFHFRGISLTDLNVHQTWPKYYKLLVAKQLASALCYMHCNNIVHRDFKIENALVITDGTQILATLIDLGLSVTGIKWHKCTSRLNSWPAFYSRAEEQSKARPDDGSEIYFPPETKSHLQYSFATDVYCFGLALLEMFIGTSVMEKLRKHHGAQHYCTLVEQNLIKIETKDAGLNSLITRCLASLPVTRPTMEQVMQDLDKLILLTSPDNDNSFLTKLANEISNRKEMTRFNLSKTESKAQEIWNLMFETQIHK